MAETIEASLYRHSREQPQKVALAVAEGGAAVTYAELWERILRYAAYFRETCQPGGRVVVAASKDAEFVYAYFGAHLAGLVCVPVDAETNAVRLGRIAESARPSLCVGRLRNQGGLDVVPFGAVSGALPASGGFGGEFPAEDAPADLLFTTGTTGMPKGVVLSYANQRAAADNINAFIRNTPDDVELLALPVSHSFGLGRLRCVLRLGGTVVLLGSFASMKKFYGAMDACGVTGFGMVPASWAYLMKMSGDRLGEYAGRLRYIEIGSSFMPLEHKRHLMALLPQTRICMHYGLTEASRSAFISFHDDAGHLDSIGHSSPNTDIRIFAEDGREAPAGTEGEVCVRGGHVCSGYWGQDGEAFRSDFYGDYFRTGDWGYMSPDGYVYLKSRKKELINVGGKKVSPVEVEEALNALEGIAESACVGVPDSVLGEVVKAYIVPCGRDVDLDGVRKALAGQLEGYKQPACYEVVESIPKTPSGKIQRLLLKTV